MKKTVIVTGGSSGIGKSPAELLAGKGYTVYTVSRGEHTPVGKAHIRADVSDPVRAAAAVEAVVEAEGGVDILVNCAGFGISGAAEFTQPEDSRRQMEVNLFGTDNMIRAVL
ncbi:MAG: SDR family NAD(P)-dependent oxidoreductase, partial [Oscillospiraceae bacterium]|nr:SDR family NAD(P)-dependent oxidoreductase [Oscillospiraceae bacterium]